MTHSKEDAYIAVGQLLERTRRPHEVEVTQVVWQIVHSYVRISNLQGKAVSAPTHSALPLTPVQELGPVARVTVACRKWTPGNS